MRVNKVLSSEHFDSNVSPAHARERLFLIMKLENLRTKIINLTYGRRRGYPTHEVIRRFEVLVTNWIGKHITQLTAADIENLRIWGVYWFCLLLSSGHKEATALSEIWQVLLPAPTNLPREVKGADHEL